MWEKTPVPLCCIPGVHTESWDTTVRAGPSPSSIPEDATACGRQPGDAVPVQAGQAGRAVLFACPAVLGCPEQVRSSRPGISQGQNSYRNRKKPFCPLCLNICSKSGHRTLGTGEFRELHILLSLPTILLGLFPFVSATKTTLLFGNL